ncbi:peroxidase 11-like protein, partial [Trifolium pratense]
GGIEPETLRGARSKGCDGSILLDDTYTLKGEKKAATNIHSLKGFEVIDKIKNFVESECPGIVSCADILTIAARDAVILVGGPYWDVPVGRKDSVTASFELANTNLPTPDESLVSIIPKFFYQGLSVTDMVALVDKFYNEPLRYVVHCGPTLENLSGLNYGSQCLPEIEVHISVHPIEHSSSHHVVTYEDKDDREFLLSRATSIAVGSHTIGMARCQNFRSRIYGDYESTSVKNPISDNQLNNLKSICPPIGGGDNNITAMDYVTPNLFDNSFYQLLLKGEGVLNSDQEMYSSVFGIQTRELVKKYAADSLAFFQQFSDSMVKMGNITNSESFVTGEVRKNCRFVNT